MHLQDPTRKHSTLHNLNWKKIYEQNSDIATQDEFAAKLHSALSRLHKTTEITLLHALSTALKESTSTHVIQMRFHVLCMTLLADNADHRETTAASRIRWRKKISEYTKDKKDDGSMKLEDVRSIPSRKKRNIFRSKRSDYCLDLRSNPHDDECLGMCGPGCTCWSFVCGNCCYNKLCLEHDKCCRHNKYSLKCWLPFVYSLSCKGGFGGYPSCLD